MRPAAPPIAIPIMAPVESAGAGESELPEVTLPVIELAVTPYVVKKVWEKVVEGLEVASRVKAKACEAEYVVAGRFSCTVTITDPGLTETRVA